MTKKQKTLYGIKYCDHCAEIELQDWFITNNQMEAIMIAGFCRSCEAYSFTGTPKND
jgi:hypothetical protein